MQHFASAPHFDCNQSLSWNCSTVVAWMSYVELCVRLGHGLASRVSRLSTRYPTKSLTAFPLALARCFPLTHFIYLSLFPSRRALSTGPRLCCLWESSVGIFFRFPIIINAIAYVSWRTKLSLSLSLCDSSCYICVYINLYIYTNSHPSIHLSIHPCMHLSPSLKSCVIGAAISCIMLRQ